MLSLSIASGLNLLCLAVITYHVAAQVQDPRMGGILPKRPPEAVAAPPTSEVSASVPDIRGNIDLEPMPRRILAVAAGIEPANTSPSQRHAAVPIEQNDRAASAGRAPSDSGRPSGHWVQLGALSKEATAERYWSDLLRRHAALLRDLEPRFFGPAEVGGGLHHIRVGPMTDNAAADLCGALTAAGADCFCLGPRAPLHGSLTMTFAP